MENNGSIGTQFNVPLNKRVFDLCMIIIMELCINSIYTISIFVGPLEEVRGWSPNMIVIAYTIVMFCETPSYFIGGLLMNKFGRKKLQVACGVIYGLAIMVSGLTQSVILFIICQGVMAGLSMMIVYFCNIVLINSVFTKNKGLVMGIMYGASGIGGVIFAPLLTYLIGIFNVTTVLVAEGAIFAVVLFISTVVVYDPTMGDKKLQAKIQEEADAAEAAEAIAGKAENALPTMRWKKALAHPAIWMIFVSIIMIQMIGNVLVTDIAVLGEKIFNVSEMDSAWVVSGFSLGVGLGGILIGWISDKIGPYKTTYLLGLFSGVILLVFGILLGHNFMAYAIVCIIQGVTYGGMTTLNPIMITDSYDIKDLGTMMAIMAISYGIVGAVGPQLGLSVSFIPMIIICAVLCILGGFASKFACSTLNKYYRSVENSECVVR